MFSANRKAEMFAGLLMDYLSQHRFDGAAFDVQLNREVGDPNHVLLEVLIVEFSDLEGDRKPVNLRASITHDLVGHTPTAIPFISNLPDKLNYSARACNALIECVRLCVAAHLNICVQDITEDGWVVRMWGTLGIRDYYVDLVLAEPKPTTAVEPV
jgi:hypothetical protein